MQKIRYQKFGYVELAVTDLGVAKAFYTNVLGLQDMGLGADGSLLLRCTEDHHAVVLHQSSVPGIRASGWMLEDQRQFDPLLARLRAAAIVWEDVSKTECATRGFERVVRVQEPYTKAILEFYVGARGGTIGPFEPTVAKIIRLGHVVYGTPHVEEASVFFRDTLNFDVSDRVAQHATFMRCFPNPFHHGLGLALAPENRLHHVNFMVTEIDDIGRALNRFRSHNVSIVYGPGRHPVSDSVFLYFLDPDGLTLEYSFGMEEFAEHDAREPRLLPRAPEWSDAWGGRPDPRMGSVGRVDDLLLQGMKS